VLNILRGIGDALAQARLGLIGVALALHLAGLIVTGERWRVVVAALGTRLKLTRTVLINLAGIFVRNVTPTTGIGGDASRIMLLRAEGVPLAQATAAFAYVRLAEVPPLALVAVLSTSAVASAMRRSTTAMAITVAVLTAFALAAWTQRARARAILADLWRRTAHLRIDRVSMGLAILYAATAQVESVVRQAVVAAAFGFPLTLGQSAAITAMSIASGFVPTVGSIGAIDGTMMAGFMLFGADAHTAIAITVAERLISYGVSTALGAGAIALLGGRRILRAARDRQATTPVA